MKQHNQSLILDKWTSLPGGYGENFALSEKFIAGAQGNRLTVWNDGKIEKEVYAAFVEGGCPKWAGTSVYWGDGCFDITSGMFTTKEEIEIALNGEASIPTSPYRAYIPRMYAWSPNVEFVLVSVHQTRHKQLPNSSVVLMKKNGTSKKVLWEGNDVVPRALWMANNWIAIGSRNVEIYNYKGALIKTLSGKLIPERLETNYSESLLLIHRHDSIAVWNTETWTLIGVLSGQWLDAAISPIGDMLMGVDFDGNLSCAVVMDGLRIVKKIVSPDPIAKVAIGTDMVIGAFSKGDPIRMASVKKK